MSKGTLLNLGLLLLLGGLVLIAVYEPGKEPAAEPVRLSGLDAQAVRHIHIERDAGDAVALERRDGVWYVTEPVQALASDYRADAVARLLRAESLRRTPAADSDLAAFGLAQPEVTVTYDGDTRIALGATTPVDRRRYALLGDTVHLLEDTAYYHLVGDVTTFVDTRLLPPQVRLARLELPAFSLTHTEQGWRAEPEPADFSQDAANALVERWLHARAIEVRPHPAPAQGERIRADFRDGEQAVEWVIVERSPDLVLVRPDQGLRYHLPDSQAEQLLELQALPE